MELEGPIELSELAGGWDREADVVVVGLGVAGVCAALEAQRAGAEVLVIERASGGGGASAASEGIFYLGGGTAVQEACGFADSPENMFAFMRASTTSPDESGLRLFCDNAVEHFDWLEAQGVPFERKAYTSKAVAVRTGEGLLFTGNEKVWPYREIASPAPRGHQTRANAEEKGGAVAMRALLATYEAEAVPTLYDTAVVGLVSEGGAVVGIRARSGGQPLTVRARRGVVLASGSFNLNKDLTDAHFPVLSRYGAPLGTDASDGTGLLLAQGVGAATRGMDGVIGTASIYPPENLIKGIVVNKLGQRFVAEDSYHGRLAWFVERQPDHVAYLIVDEEIFDYPEKGSHKMLDGFLTVSEAETGLGLPEGSLEATLSEYNRDVADGVDRRFRKDAHWLKPLAAPLVAFDISIPSSDYHYISLGGVSTDNDGRVLAGDGRVVEGLYAAGAVAAHFPQNGAEYASGMSLGPGSFFGRRAGRHAAARRP